MRRALAHARRGIGRTTPNPVVGACVVTPDGVVVGDGSHERAGGPHAEVNALDAAGTLAQGSTLYCTLEPCVHRGHRRTGPCTERIIASGIARVVAAVTDPYPRVNGQGFEMLRAHGIAVTVGVGAEAASRLNQAYLMSLRQHRPWVIAKVAVSADGYVSAAPGVRTELTSAPARRHAHTIRASVDAVAVGSETVLIDDPELTVREVYRARPLTRVIFDRRLRTPATAAVLRSRAAGPVLVLTSPAALADRVDHARTLEARGAVLIPVPTGLVRDGLQALSAYDVQSVVVEGGPTLHAACWDEDVVDQVHVYVAPTVIGYRGVSWGTDAMLTLSGRTRLRAQAIGRDVFMDGYVHRAD